MIGSGAAGAALTWRLASQGATVVCLEQGDWLRPDDFASERHDCEASLRRGRYALLPGARRRPEDYPVTTAGDGPSDIVMWNGVGGSTVHWEGHFPRFHPSDFAVRRLDGVADDWPIAYTDLEPFYDINDAMIGVSGLAGDPANAPRAPAHHAAAAARPIRRSAGSRLREARLALVAVRQCDHLARLRRPHRLRQPRPLQLRLPAEGEGVGRRRLLAEGDRRRARG